jgi:CheY-like chemotaxis protein
VKSGTSVAAALAILRMGFLPRAIVFDLMMPEQDGFAFLRAMFAEHLAPRAALIALTNQVTAVDKRRAVELGAIKYIVKATMTPAEVVDVVGTILNKESAV